MKTVAIAQSNYIPWKGYFDLIRRADQFIILDCVQSTKNDWRNRNRIKTANGLAWLSIPVHHATHLRIDEVEVADGRWARKHFRSLAQSYARAPFMKAYREEVEEVYRRAGERSRLSEINRLFVDWICTRLGIDTPIVDARKLLPIERIDALSASARLVEFCRLSGADCYLSGPAALDYIQEDLFEAADLKLAFMDYAGYPEYPQLHGPYEHRVSAVDLILMTGPKAAAYLEKPDVKV